MLCCLSLSARPRVLLLDLGGLFYKYSSLSYASELGLGELVEYRLLDRKNFQELEQVIFKVLNEVPQEDIVSLADEFKHSLLYKALLQKGEGEVPRIITTKTSSGRELPHIISAFQAGHLSSQVAFQLALKSYNDYKKSERFTSEQEARLVERALRIIFTPSKSVAMNEELPQGTRLLKELAESVSDGEHKPILVAFSNVDKESALLFEQRFKTSIFDHFAYSYYSGDLGTVKPNKEAFKLVIDSLNEKNEFQEKPLDLDDIVFMDDQIENIEAAHQVGIKHAILYKNAYQARKELAAFQVPLLTDKTLGSMSLVGAFALCVLAAYFYFV